MLREHVETRARRLEALHQLFAVEKAPALASLGVVAPGHDVDGSFDRRAALLSLLRARNEVNGPMTSADQARDLGLPLDEVESCLDELVRNGELLRGRFDGQITDECTWSRRLVVRARRRALERLRADIQPVSPRDFMRYLLRWQGVDPGPGAGKLHGIEGLKRVLERLDGVSVAASAWEDEVLPARLHEYDPSLLDQLCLSGHVEWTRVEGTRNGPPPTLKSTPIALVERTHAPLFVRDPVDDNELSANARAVLLWALRRLEMRGEIRGGRFVTGFSGEQFALPEAVGLVRNVRKEPLDGRRITLSAADPLNLTGVILPGARVPLSASRRVVFEDGVVVSVIDAEDNEIDVMLN